MVRDEVADLEVSACETAETCTVALGGTLAGAVYRPEVVMVPDAVLPPAVSFTFQVTAVFEVPLTVAVYCWVPSTGRSAEVGEIETVTALLGSGGTGAEAEGAAEPPPHPILAVETTARSRTQNHLLTGDPLTKGRGIR